MRSPHNRLMDVGTVGTLLQVTFLQAQIDGKKADAVAVDGTDILFACNDADKAAAQQAVKEYAACAGPLLARAVKDCLTADQLTVNVRLRACYTTVSLDEIVKKTIMAAIVKERLVDTDPSVVAPVDWQAHGLIMDKAKDVLVIKMTTGSVFDQPTPKPTRGVAATSTKLIVNGPSIKQLRGQSSPRCDAAWGIAARKYARVPLLDLVLGEKSPGGALTPGCLKRVLQSCSLLDGKEELTAEQKQFVVYTQRLLVVCEAQCDAYSDAVLNHAVRFATRNDADEEAVKRCLKQYWNNAVCDFGKYFQFMFMLEYVNMSGQPEWSSQVPQVKSILQTFQEVQADRGLKSADLEAIRQQLAVVLKEDDAAPTQGLEGFTMAWLEHVDRLWREAMDAAALSEDCFMHAGQHDMPPRAQGVTFFTARHMRDFFQGRDALLSSAVYAHKMLTTWTAVSDTDACSGGGVLKTVNKVEPTDALARSYGQMLKRYADARAVRPAAAVEPMREGDDSAAGDDGAHMHEPEAAEPAAARPPRIKQEATEPAAVGSGGAEESPAVASRGATAGAEDASACAASAAKTAARGAVKPRAKPRASSSAGRGAASRQEGTRGPRGKGVHEAGAASPGQALGRRRRRRPPARYGAGSVFGADQSSDLCGPSGDCDVDNGDAEGEGAAARCGGAAEGGSDGAARGDADGDARAPAPTPSSQRRKRPGGSDRGDDVRKARRSGSGGAGENVGGEAEVPTRVCKPQTRFEEGKEGRLRPPRSDGCSTYLLVERHAPGSTWPGHAVWTDIPGLDNLDVEHSVLWCERLQVWLTPSHALPTVVQRAALGTESSCASATHTAVPPLTRTRATAAAREAASQLLGLSHGAVVACLSDHPQLAQRIASVLGDSQSK